MAFVGEVEDTVKGIPDDHLPKGKGDKQRLLKLARELDELTRVEEGTDEVFFDEQRSRKLFEKLTPKSNEQFVNELVADLKERPGGELLREGHGKSRAISGKEFRSRVGAEEPPWEETLEGWGLSTQSTEEEFRKAIKQRMPDYPEELLKPGGWGRRRRNPWTSWLRQSRRSVLSALARVSS
jgi:hypothetical protein